MEALLSAIDELIAKYSNTEYQWSTVFACSLCRLFYDYNSDLISNTTLCPGCPNQVFAQSSVGCVQRGVTYPRLSYFKLENYPNLVEFWVIVKELIISGESIDSAMLKAAIQFPLPDEDAT